MLFSVDYKHAKFILSSSRHNGDDVRHRCIRCPHFLAVDTEVLAVAYRTGPYFAHARADVWLTDGRASNHFASDEFWQIASLNLFRSARVNLQTGPFRNPS